MVAVRRFRADCIEEYKRTAASTNAEDILRAHTPKDSRARTYAKAKKTSEKEHADSQFPPISNDLPEFTLSEISLGKVLGKGGFGTVLEVQAFSLSNAGHQNLSSKDQAARKFLSQHCLRQPSGDARYAIKLTSPEITRNPKALYRALVDNAAEVRYLSALEHPHIVKLRAINSGGMFTDGSFLVMDRLYDTLIDRLQVWDSHLKQFRGIFGKAMRDRDGSRRAAVWEERLVAAFNLSSAMAYLHARRIIHRDLKPENIGFDIRDDIKLFDFGLAREVPPVEKSQNGDGRFKMTQCGSPRYMAPEIGRGDSYDEKCDVYSFAMLLWEMLSLVVPFAQGDMQLLVSKVWRGPCVRPPIKQSWGSKIQQLIKEGWDDDMSARPSMETFSKRLRAECVEAKQGDDTGLINHDRRRSTYLFDHRAMLVKELSSRSGLSIAKPPTRHCSAISAQLEATRRGPYNDLDSADGAVVVVENEEEDEE
eukprot:Nitzschia sp. Nitz4//scaffold293_size23253//16701//18224//NITZ4_008508-RA/size23253-augustus-gene-0.6-mRNA-1//1//CDS//3329546204//51//frame0